MFLLDAPYVSDFLKQTVATLGLPVLDTPIARSFTSGATVDFVDEGEFARHLRSGGRIYANSENGLDQIVRSAGDSDLSRQIGICKDKTLFRKTVAPLHPGYRFMRATPEALETLDITDMKCPFVVKPARGFFSLGVHVVSSHDQWSGVVRAIRDEREAMNAEYPETVVNSGEYIIEDGIDGEEYAIDVYYDAAGEPVITNILHHHFISAEDISDRLYYTSSDIIATWLAPFLAYVGDMGRVCNFRDFPIHLEVRVDQAGVIIPIEANPLRFAGWCVADITAHAWGFNPYEYYFKGMRPDWPAILLERADSVCAMVIGDVPSNIDRKRIEKIDYDGFCDQFDTVLELRRIDHTAYPLFAFVFIRTDGPGLDSLKSMIATDFSLFITMKPESI